MHLDGLFRLKINKIQEKDFVIDNLKTKNDLFKFLISIYFRFTHIFTEMNRTAKKSSRERKSIDKISTTNSTIRFKDIIDRNVVKLNSNVYMDKKNFFNTAKKTN